MDNKDTKWFNELSERLKELDSKNIKDIDKNESNIICANKCFKNDFVFVINNKVYSIYDENLYSLLYNLDIPDLFKLYDDIDMYGIITISKNTKDIINLNQIRECNFDEKNFIKGSLYSEYKALRNILKINLYNEEKDNLLEIRQQRIDLLNSKVDFQKEDIDNLNSQINLFKERSKNDISNINIVKKFKNLFKK